MDKMRTVEGIKRGSFKLGQVKQWAQMRAQAPERSCAIHKTSYWGKDKNGNYYKRCFEGNKNNQDCVVEEK